MATPVSYFPATQVQVGGFDLVAFEHDMQLPALVMQVIHFTRLHDEQELVGVALS